MQTPSQILEHLFPYGSRGIENGIDLYPRWPVDMFGACAYLLQLSDRYTDLVDESKNVFADIPRDKLIQIGQSWSYLGYLEEEYEAIVQEHWETILDCNTSIAEQSETIWVTATIHLLIIADIASAGIGFYDKKLEEENSEVENSWVQTIYYALNTKDLSSKLLRDQSLEDCFLKALESDTDTDPQSLSRVTACILIPSDILCVHPKTRTPSVGCTLRSLSHHLALLPSRGQIQVMWNDNEKIWSYKEGKPFNILLIPYPYELNGKDFTDVTNSRARSPHSNKHGYFDIEQNWLTNTNHPANKGTCIVERVLTLVENAQEQVEAIDMVLLPELSLNNKTYRKLERELRKKFHKTLQLLVAGVKSESKNGSIENVARSTFFLGDKETMLSEQKKHHRWKLDRSQIESYAAGDALNPQKEWWENINIGKRELDFVVFRDGACFTTLICEDLARVDPCQAAIRSIGPNLVFALLMDGPQIKGRWPERYALSLSDDPGCSVLTVTSLGTIIRSNHEHGSNKRTVAMWKDGERGTREIELPIGYDAIALTLTDSRREEITLDGRSDSETAVVWRLTGKTPIKHDKDN